QQAGGNCALTETPRVQYDTGDHDCWSVAFAEERLLDWLLAQHRGAPISWPPGSSLGRRMSLWLGDYGWVVLAWLGIAIVMWVVWIRHRRQRRTSGYDDVQ